MKKGLAVLPLVMVVALVIFFSAAAYYFGTQRANRSVPIATPSVSPTTSGGVACTMDAKLCPDGKTSVGRIPPDCEFATCPDVGPSAVPARPGWLLYKNEQYAFQISYPSNYKALTDKDNLYGWPNAAVLIYSGGQSYDLPIEVWNSPAEYQAKYKNPANLVVKEINGKFITLMNVNFLPEVDEIIATFKPL